MPFSLRRSQNIQAAQTGQPEPQGSGSLSKLKKASRSLMVSLRQVAADLTPKSMRNSSVNQRLSKKTVPEQRPQPRLELSEPTSIARRNSNTQAAPHAVEKIRPRQESLNLLSDAKGRHIWNPLLDNSCLDQPSKRTGIDKFRDTPMGQALGQVLTGRAPRHVDLVFDSSGKEIEKDASKDLAVWTRDTCKDFIQAKNADTVVFVVRNQSQLDQLLTQAGIESGNLVREQGELLHGLRQGAILIVDEAGFSAAELEALNELKQNNCIAGEQFLENPPLILSIVDKNAQSSGLRSSALSSRADYQRIPFEQVSGAVRPNVLSSKHEPLTSFGQNQFVLCGGGGWESLRDRKPLFTESGWVVQPPFLQSHRLKGQDKGLVFVGPPLHDLTFLDFLFELQEAGVAYTLVDEMPASALKPLQSNKFPLTNETPLRVDAENVDHLLASQTLVDEGATQLRPGLLHRNEEPLALEITSSLSSQQWMALMCAPRSLALRAQPHVNVPIAFRAHVDQSKNIATVDEAQDSVDESTPGVFKKYLSPQEQAALRATSDQTQIFVTPDMSLSDLILQWKKDESVQSGSTSLRLDSLVLEPKQLLLDLQAGKRVIIHGLDKNSELASELAALKGADGQLHIGGKTLCWAGSTLPKQVSPLQLKGQIIIANPSNTSPMHRAIEFSGDLALAVGVNRPLEDVSRYDQIEGSRQEQARLLKEHRCLFLQGAPGVGKTYQANSMAKQLGMKAVHLDPKDIGTPQMKQKLLDWGQPEGGPSVLIVDEANLAPEGTFDFLNEFVKDNTLLIDGKRTSVPRENRVIFTGNSDTTEGRIQHEVIDTLFHKHEVSALNSTGLLKTIAAPVRDLLAQGADALQSVWRREHLPSNDLLRLLTSNHEHLVKTPGLERGPRLLRQAVTAFTLARSQGFGVEQARALALTQVYKDAAPFALQPFVQQSIQAMTGSGDIVTQRSATVQFSDVGIVPTESSKVFAAKVDRWLDAQRLLASARVNTAGIETFQSIGTRALLIEGPAGRGKDKVVLDRLKRTMDASAISALNMSTDVDLFAKKLKDAIVSGKTLVVSELNLAPSSVLESLLNPILNGDDCDLDVHPNFCLIGTVNPTGYAGRRAFSGALESRMNHLKLGDYHREDLEFIVTQTFLRGGQNSKESAHYFAKTLVDHHVALERKLEAQHLTSKPTTRELVRVAQMAGQREFALLEGALDSLLDRSYGFYTDLLDQQSAQALKPMDDRVCGLTPESYINALRHLTAPHIRGEILVAQAPSQGVPSSVQKGVFTHTDQALTYSGPLKSEAINSAFELLVRKEVQVVKQSPRESLVFDRLSLEEGNLRFRQMTHAKPIGQVLNMSPLENIGYLKLRNQDVHDNEIRLGTGEVSCGPRSMALQYAADARGFFDAGSGEGGRTLLVPAGYTVESVQYWVSGMEFQSVAFTEKHGIFKAMIPESAIEIELQLNKAPDVASKEKFKPVNGFFKGSKLDLSPYPELKEYLGKLESKFKAGELELSAAVADLRQWIMKDSEFVYSLDYEDISDQQTSQQNAQEMLSRRNGKCTDYAALGARLIAQTFAVPTQMASGYRLENNGKIPSESHQWTEFYDAKACAWRTVDFNVSKLRAGLEHFALPEPNAENKIKQMRHKREALRARAEQVSGLNVSFGDPVEIASSVLRGLAYTKVISDNHWIKTVSDRLAPLIKNLPTQAQVAQFNSDGRGVLDLHRLIQGKDTYFKTQQGSGGQNQRVVIEPQKAQEFSLVTYSELLLKNLGVHIGLDTLSNAEKRLPLCTDVDAATAFLRQLVSIVLDEYVDYRLESLKTLKLGDLAPIETLSLEQKLAVAILDTSLSDISFPAQLNYKGEEYIISAEDALSVTPYRNILGLPVMTAEKTVDHVLAEPDLFLGSKSRREYIYEMIGCSLVNQDLQNQMMEGLASTVEPALCEALAVRLQEAGELASFDSLVKRSMSELHQYTDQQLEYAVGEEASESIAKFEQRVFGMVHVLASAHELSSETAEFLQERIEALPQKRSTSNKWNTAAMYRFLIPYTGRSQ